MSSSIDPVSSSKADVAQEARIGGAGGGDSNNSMLDQLIYQMLLDSIQSNPSSTPDNPESGTGGSGQPAATQVNQIN